MSTIKTIVAGTLRFAGALLVGLVFWKVFQFSTMAYSRHLVALSYPFLILVLVFCFRFAARKRTKIDRAVGAFSAATAAAISLGIGIGALWVGGIVMGFFLVLFFGGLGRPAAEYFAPISFHIYVISTFALAGAGLLTYAAHRIWKSR